MRGTLRNRFIWARVAGIAGLGALLFTAACGTSQNAPALPGQAAAAQQPSTPIVVSCEPNQRTLVRPVMVNGAAMSQVECVSSDNAVVQNAAAQLSPVSYYPAPAVRETALSDTRYVPASSYHPVASSPRVVPARQVVYDDRPVRDVRQGRSVKKSAIIIGSSAGIGAGVGAAVSGKKGALIGAAIGGGGAAIWDQMTRRNDR